MADLAARPAFTDHYLRDLRLARVNASGKGAAARFVLKPPLREERGELAIVEADRPRRIVEERRLGRLGRSRFVAVYEFTAQSGGTRVELSTLSDPVGFDRIRKRGCTAGSAARRRPRSSACVHLRGAAQGPLRG